jgi:TRAP transporter TAXI family solute receptor
MEEKMKHFTKMTLSTILAGATSLSLALSAYGAEKIKMATIAPGSSAYLVMTTMASIVNNAQDDYVITVDATGAATKHQIEAAKGQLDIVMTSPTIYLLMAKGKAMYKKMASAPELSKNLGLIYWFPYGAYHTIVYDDSGINSLKDIKGKKVFLGPPGGGAFNTAKQWIEAASGLKPGKDFEPVKASWSSALQGFQDRQFDVYINGGIPPFPTVEQLALTSKIRLLGLTKEQGEARLADENFKKVVKGLGRRFDIIKSGTYGAGVTNKEDVYTVGATVGVSARMDLSEDAVYKITKVFWENLEEAQKTAPFMEKINLDGALSATNMQLHPGALKYYKEIGISIPEKLLK